MSAAKSTLSDDVHHRMLPPWGLYFFNSPRHFIIDARFCECVNHDDAMPPQGIPPQMARACAKKGVGEVTPPSVIPPHNTTQNCGTIIRFDGR